MSVLSQLFFGAVISTPPKIWTTSTSYPIATARLKSVGSPTSVLATGGMQTGNSNAISTCYKFNGTTWSSTGSFVAARSFHGIAGVQSSALVLGGYNNAIESVEQFLMSCEKFNGTSWSTSTNLLDRRFQVGSCGSSANSAITATGYNSAYSLQSSTWLFDGTSWTATSNYEVTNVGMTMFGIVTSCIGCGGQPSAVTKNTYKYTGTSWSYVGLCIVARKHGESCGTSTDGIMFGGYGLSGSLNSTELLSGTNWASGNNMITARDEFGGSGNTVASSNAIAICNEYRSTSVEIFS